MPEKEKIEIKLTTNPADEQSPADAIAHNGPTAVTPEKSQPNADPPVNQTAPARFPARSDWRIQVAKYGRYVIAAAVVIVAVLSTKPLEHKRMSEMTTPEAVLVEVARLDRQFDAAGSAWFDSSSGDASQIAMERDQDLNDAQAALVRMGPKIVPALIHHLEIPQYSSPDTSRSSASVAEEVLSAFGSQSIDPVMQGMRKDVTPKTGADELSTEFVTALMMIGEPATQRLFDLIDSKNADERDFAFKVLSRIAEMHPPERVDVKAGINVNYGVMEGDVQRKCGALRLHSTEKDHVQRLLKQNLTSDQRATLLGLLGRCELDVNVVNQLESVAADQSEEIDVRSGALDALCDLFVRNGGIADQVQHKTFLPLIMECRRTLDKAARDTHNEIAEPGSRAGAKISETDSKLVDLLKPEILGENEAAAEAALQYATEFDKESPASDANAHALLELVGNESLPQRRKFLALQILSKLGTDIPSDDAARVMQQYLRHQPRELATGDFEANMNAIKILQSCGADAQTALPLLKQIMATNGDARIINQARQAARFIEKESRD
jgi:hypothetical protein